MSPKLYIPTAAEVDAAVASLTQRQPSEAVRFARAAAIVLAGAIGHDAHTGWTVASQGKKTGAIYQVTPLTCECADHRFHGRACKHLDAMLIFRLVLASKLDAMMPEVPEDLYFRLLAQGCSEADAASATDEASIDPILGDATLFVLPGTQSNQRHLLDRVSGNDICTVQRNPNWLWRPCTPADTLAWAQWLGAAQGEREGVAVAMDPAPVAPQPDYEARAKLAARMGVGETWVNRAAQTHALLDSPPSSIPVSQWEKSPYKAHQRNAYKYAQR